MRFEQGRKSHHRADGCTFLSLALSLVPQLLIPDPGGSIEVPAKLLIANASSAGDSTAATIDVAEQMNKMVGQMAAMQTGMAGVKGDLAAANAKIVGLAGENDAMRTNMTALANKHAGALAEMGAAHQAALDALRSEIAKTNSTTNDAVVEQEDGTFLASPAFCAVFGGQISAFGNVDPQNPCLLPTTLYSLVLEHGDSNHKLLTLAPLLIGVKKITE